MDIITDADLSGAKPATTPLPKGFKFCSTEDTLFANPDQYHRLVGRLLYLGFTRPDLAYAVQQLSQHVQHPCTHHWEATVHVLHYLKGYPSKDWASCPTTRKFLTGYCVYLGSSLISWKTKKQTTVSSSSAEAGYRSLASTDCRLRQYWQLAS
ncbi:uncharacterized protein LOC116114901 [Pistacia vera]|uniref:uncharacterized protein LOC116114901 n=1 Tax=Pistacia vera TaxID=55513 RepID=UPI001263CB1A|nr:uncharacterized protein LOC116114901 [Pistacia vera]